MDTSKIKIRIGEHEFEAEGPAEIVQAQFETFKELLKSESAKTIAAPVVEVKEEGLNKGLYTSGEHLQIEKVLHVSGRVVSLTAIPSAAEDAILLIMLGHKDLRNHLTVTGQEIGDGLDQSGKPVGRVDRVMEKNIANAYVIKTGIKRATRYRLTNQGNQKALAIARDLIATLPD